MNKTQRDKKIKNDLIRSMGERFVSIHNPLGIPFKTFDSYTTVYLWVLGMMKKQYPKGYVDFILFTSDLIDQPAYVIYDLFGTNHQFSKDAYLFEWSSFSREEINILRLFFQTLHSRMGTVFSESHFQDALNIFFNSNKDEN